MKFTLQILPNSDFEGSICAANFQPRQWEFSTQLMQISKTFNYRSFLPSD
ncbi:MAG TPA: hypothetical protein IGS40_20865 [Trichormus sp. M33_DOE_039]|nr:hypothetical protein [Trichormus sp. M33_DOE_039]